MTGKNVQGPLHQFNIVDGFVTIQDSDGRMYRIEVTNETEEIYIAIPGLPVTNANFHWRVFGDGNNSRSVVYVSRV